MKSNKNKNYVVREIKKYIPIMILRNFIYNFSSSIESSSTSTYGKNDK